MHHRPRFRLGRTSCCSGAVLEDRDKKAGTVFHCTCPGISAYFMAFTGSRYRPSCMTSRWMWLSSAHSQLTLPTLPMVCPAETVSPFSPWRPPCRRPARPCRIRPRWRPRGPTCRRCPSPPPYPPPGRLPLRPFRRRNPRRCGCASPPASCCRPAHRPL